ncbi:MAG: guanylate kinase [Rickettsiaceae bacterium]
MSIILILSSPSGCGKSTVARVLVNQDKNLKLSISATTREMRNNELDGVDYHFKSKEEFQDLLDKNKLLEHTFLYGNFYGTLKSDVQSILDKNVDVVFDIDANGLKSLQSSLCKNHSIISVFLLPPKPYLHHLKQRLSNRENSKNHNIELRLQNAQKEISYAQYYDFVITNDKLYDTVSHIELMLQNARLSALNKSISD